MTRHDLMLDCPVLLESCDTRSSRTQGTAARPCLLAPSRRGLMASHAPLLRGGRGASLAVIPPPGHPSASTRAADEDCLA